MAEIHCNNYLPVILIIIMSSWLKSKYLFSPDEDLAVGKYSAGTHLVGKLTFLEGETKFKKSDAAKEPS